MAEKNIRIGSSGEGIQKLDRSKLQRKVQVSGEDGSSSIKSIIMLVIIIVLVAITGAYVVKNLQSSNPDTTSDTGNLTTSPTEPPSVINSNVEQDMFDEYKVTTKTYTDKDMTIQGNESGQYELQNFAAQPFESFYRLTFDFATKQEEGAENPVNDEESSEEVAGTAISGSGSQLTESSTLVSENLPPAEISYKSKEQGFEELEVVFSNIVKDNLNLAKVFGTQNLFNIENSSVAVISYDPIDDEGNLSFKVALNDLAEYYVQVVDNKVVLDIQESTNRGSEVNPTGNPSVSPTGSDIPNPSVTPKVSNDPATSENFTVKIESKNITAGTKARISGYTFDDTTDKFIYNLLLAGSEVPKVSARLTAENTLEVKIEEISYDGLTKDGKAFTDFSAKGVKDVITMNVTFGGTTSNYIYALNSKKNYDIKLGSKDGINSIMIEIEH